MSNAPPPPGAPSHTPRLYLTPQLEKRRDGLAPSLLDLSLEDVPSSDSLMSKKYRTASAYFNGGSTDIASVNVSVELQRLTDSITATLEDLVDRERGAKDLRSMTFAHQGCVWTLQFHPSLRADSYQLQVVCKACADQIGHCYVVETVLVPKQKNVTGGSNDVGLAEAKTSFEYVALQVRKAVVRCEFPDFPEGCKGRPFRDVYQLNARLKSGSFATVCRGTHRATGKKVAIKCVLRKDLPPSDDAAIFDEVAILASLEHPHIIPLIDFFDESECYFIIMELMSGGDLFDRIGKKKAYSEADARDLCSKMLKAMAYCHQRNIAHCDMKPKNLLLLNDENDSYIKLADFGFAARVHSPKSLTKQCGTPFFVSPEILMRAPYDTMADMWSVGCIVFLLLGGNLPFMGRTQKELFRKIVIGKYEFDSDWATVSDDARDLVSRLLVTDPDQRLTAMQALKHPWLRRDSSRLSLIMLSGTSQRLKTFNARMKLRSAMIAVDWVSSLQRNSGWTTTNADLADVRKDVAKLTFEKSPKTKTKLVKAETDSDDDS